MRIALALGSGGARGYTHIGVVQELAERGHEVVAVAGTSMGAVVGGLTAIGRLEPFTEWVESLSQRDVWLLLDPAFRGPGAFWGHRVMERVADILQGARIEELPIPFTAVATDLIQGREVWFHRGPLATAMRASIGVPSVFTPIMVGGRLLADGGLLNPVPVDALLGTPADVTVAVSLSGRRANDYAVRPISDTADNDTFLGEITQRLRDVLESDAARGVRQWWADRFQHPVSEAEVPSAGALVPAVSAEGAASPTAVREFQVGELPRGLRTTEVVSRSLETAEALITRFRMAASPPDVLIEFPLDLASMFDFHRATELIARGREAASEALDAAGL